jgi:hypothetical protein
MLCPDESRGGVSFAIQELSRYVVLRAARPDATAVVVQLDAAPAVLVDEATAGSFRHLTRGGPTLEAYAGPRPAPLR